MPIQEKAMPVNRQKGRYHHGDLRTALLSAARHLLEERGPDGFTMKDASQMAGVSVAAPYRHFSDRDALLAALSETAFQERGEEMEQILARHAEGSIEAIIEMGQCYVRHAVEQPGMFAVMFGSGDETEDKYPNLHQAADRCFGTLLAAISAFIKAHNRSEEDLLNIAAQLWAMVHGTASLQIQESFTKKIPTIDIMQMVEHGSRYTLLGYLQSTKANQAP